MQGIEHNIEGKRLLRGTALVADAGWQPRRVNTEEVARAIRAASMPFTEDKGHQDAYVERLALAHNAMMRKGRADAVPEWSELEMLGNEVSPAFSELGVVALELLEGAIALARGEQIREGWMNSCYLGLGLLWSAAFGAPEGFSDYISKSAQGLLPQERSFFSLPPKHAGLTPEDEGKYLLGMIDLLQAAIAATRNLHDSVVGVEPTMPTWSNRVGKAGVLPSIERNIQVEVHAMHQGLPHGERMEVVLKNAATGESLGAVQAVVLEGRTGMYDEFPELADGCGPIVEDLVRALFWHERVVGVSPRVRALLDTCGNKLQRICIIEGMVMKPLWRGGTQSKRLLGQLMMEAGRLDAVFARPMPVQPSFESIKAGRGIMAGLALGALRLSGGFARIGGKVMVDGIMGIDAADVADLQEAGKSLRFED